ncbi:MAG: hypothetical protein AAB903_02420 [Patescibacteria group bacterium]
MFSKQLIIRSLGLIVGSFILGFLILAWLRNDIAAQASKAQLLKADISRDSNLLPALATLKDSAEKASVHEKRLLGLLPEKDTLIDFRSFLTALGNQRVVATSFSFEGVGSPTGQGNLGSIGFSLDMTGSLSGIEGLLQDIETKPRSYLLAFDTFSFSKSEAGYRGVFRGRLFYRETTLR